MFWPKGPSNHNDLPLQDYIPSIRRSIRASWQSRWDQCAADGSVETLTRPMVVLFSAVSPLRNFPIHFRIVHTRLAHGHLMAHEVLPVCNHC